MGRPGPSRTLRPVPADQPAVTAASEPIAPPTDDPDHTTTPGNGTVLIVPRQRHRFVPDDAANEAGTSERAADAPHHLTKRERRALGRLRARKVRRIVRHIDPWSVLKLSLLFYFCLFLVLLVAGTLLYNLAGAAGTISSIESFIKDIGAFKTFTFKGGTIFRASALARLIL